MRNYCALNHPIVCGCSGIGHVTASTLLNRGAHGERKKPCVHLLHARGQSKSTLLLCNTGALLNLVAVDLLLPQVQGGSVQALVRRSGSGLPKPGTGGAPATAARGRSQGCWECVSKVRGGAARCGLPAFGAGLCGRLGRQKAASGCAHQQRRHVRHRRCAQLLGTPTCLATALPVGITLVVRRYSCILQFQLLSLKMLHNVSLKCEGCGVAGARCESEEGFESHLVTNYLGPSLLILLLLPSLKAAARKVRNGSGATPRCCPC